MKKALIIGLIGAVALVVVAKKTNMFSYASTLCAQVERLAAAPFPFELLESLAKAAAAGELRFSVGFGRRWRVRIGIGRARLVSDRQQAAPQSHSQDRESKQHGLEPVRGNQTWQ